MQNDLMCNAPFHRPVPTAHTQRTPCALASSPTCRMPSWSVAGSGGLQVSVSHPTPRAQVLTERVHKLVSATNPSLAVKIAGMLLELDTSEVLRLIDTPAALADRVSEAIEALKTQERPARTPNTRRLSPRQPTDVVRQPCAVGTHMYMHGRT
jgi:hypothetical protein